MDDRGNRGSQRCTQAEQIQPHRHWCLPFVPLSHETYGRAGPEAFALLNEIAEYAAGIGSVSKKLFMENAMRDLSTTLCGGVARRVIASMSRQARMDGRAVLPGLPVPADGL